MNQEYVDRTIALAAILKAHNARYVPVRKPGEKFARVDKATGTSELAEATGKEPLGAGWQNDTSHGADLLTARIANGVGNVGLMTGVNGLYILDFDSDFEGVLTRNPWLNGSITIYRESAPERGKIIFSLPQGQRLHARKKHNQIELLGPGNQGVIAGVHKSGAALEWRGDKVAEWSVEIIHALWLRETGDVFGDDMSDERKKVIARMNVDLEAMKGVDVADEAHARNFVETSFRNGAQNLSLIHI